RARLASCGITPERFSVARIKRLVQDTLQGSHPVAFAHIDVDSYDPVMSCLERIFPRLVVGGSVVLDDYYAWGGCRRAVDEELGRVSGQYTAVDTGRVLTVTRT